MNRRLRHSPIARRAAVRIAASTACALALLGAGQASGQSGQPAGQTGQPGGAPVAGVDGDARTVRHLAVQAERSATFTGEMTAVAGAARMAMRIDVEERLPGETEFHTVSAPGSACGAAPDPNVKVYKYLKQVTNLSSPASYRALVRFRWLSAKGHVIKRAERLTARCLQPALARPGRRTATPPPLAVARCGRDARSRSPPARSGR